MDQTEETRSEVGATAAFADNDALLLDRIEQSVGILQETQASVVEAARRYVSTSGQVADKSAELVSQTDELVRQISGFQEFMEATEPYMQEQAETIAQIREDSAGAVEAVNLAKSMANQAGAKAVAAEGAASQALAKAANAETVAQTLSDSIAEANQTAEAAEEVANEAANKAQAAQNGLTEKLDLAGGQMTGALNLANVAQTESGAAAIPASWSLNRHPIKLNNTKMFFVGGANASDTADLYAGRGESTALPFATLDACLRFIATNVYGPDTVYVNPQVDLSIDSLTGILPHKKSVIIESMNGRRTLTFNQSYNLGLGSLMFSNINLNLGANYMQVISHSGAPASLAFVNCEFTGTALSFKANHAGTLLRFSIGTNTFNGTVSSGDGLINAVNGGRALLMSTFAGTVTGKRYSVINGGAIYTGGKGPNYIPGTIAGTCDEGSKYW